MNKLDPEALSAITEKLANQAAQGAVDWFHFQCKNLVAQALADQGFMGEVESTEELKRILNDMERQVREAMSQAKFESFKVEEIIDDAQLRSQHPVGPKVTTGDRESFSLFNLRVSLESRGGEIVGSGQAGSHQLGEYFDVIGENLIIPPGQTVSMYSLAAALPLLPPKQRYTHPHDWMSTDAVIASPDPHCPSQYRIARTGHMVFHHDEVTAVPVKKVTERNTP